MRAGFLRTAILIFMIAACSVMFCFADEEEKDLKIYNTRMVTNDADATYIEGEVAAAKGQDIVVTNGFSTVATKTMPETGQKAQFRIKIPSKAVSKKVMTLLYVKERTKEDNGPILGQRVEIDYKEREAQSIKVARKDYSMTFPGVDENIDAQASSGDGLIYMSSDPKVATVDENGSVTPVGSGNATITVQQIGNGRYDKAEKSVKVAVEAIDAYSVTFHSSDDEEASSKQIINVNEEQPLQENSFENGNHEFMGWATEDGGLVEYTDAEDVKDLSEKGGNTDLYAVWSGDGAAAAVAWAVKIANDDSFSYGAKPATSRIGCYFCGTSQRNKPKGYEKTYVCLTFIGAAYAHGAEDPEILWADQHNKMPFYLNNDLFSKFSCWTKIGNPGSLSIDDLEPGDVVVESSASNGNDGHVWMYIGGDEYVDARGGGWGADTIAVRSGAARTLSAYGGSGNFVARYTGPNAQ